MQYGPLQQVSFGELDLADAFFDSLREDYAEFGEWFARKSTHTAWTIRGEDGKLCGFLYLKVESDALTDVTPMRPAAARLKAGTFKVEAHGTRLGERFIRLILDQALERGVEEIYVTVFPKHGKLIELFARWGFEDVGEKRTANGVERVLAKPMRYRAAGDHKDYPIVNVHGRRLRLLAIYPEFHTRLFPDSKLNTEGDDVIQDLSHTNSILKIYIGWSRAAAELRPGDVVVIYRTKDEARGAAWYSAVATSVCVLDTVLRAKDFTGENDFVARCAAYSIFTEDELRKFWRTRKHSLVVLRMLYNFALPKRPNRKALVEQAGLDAEERWSVLSLTRDQFNAILRLGCADERLIVDQT